MIPVYKIETYTDTTLDHTITNEAKISIRETLTDVVGQFTITLPTASQYEDITFFDKVKIYMGYDTVPANPNFVGKVQKIEGGLSESEGYNRRISGLALGEVLVRRLKCGHYSGSQAASIVTEFANDLGLGTSQIGSETNTPPLEFVDISYFEAMQQLSDCWIDGSTQLKKEFYVDTNNNLVYANRPLRTSGVETLTIGVNVEDYLVRRSLENTRNNITVYGNWDEKLTVKIPTDENWTESLSKWTATTGTLALDTSDKQIGAASVRCQMAGSGVNWQVDFQRSLAPEFAFISGNARSITQSYSNLHYQIKCPTASAGVYLYLFAPDSSNYYRYPDGAADSWYTHNITFPTTESAGSWTAFGNAQANFITGIRWWGQWNSQDYCRIDDLALQGGRFCYKTSDSISISSYGQRDLVVTDNSLQSAAQCEARAKTLLYQRKDPTVEVDISTAGNMNILIGDRLALVLPRENVNGNYDVTVVNHTLADKAFSTKFTAVEGINIRQALSATPITEVSRIKKDVQALARDIKFNR